MKIKHFAGYGSVEAKKVSKRTYKNYHDEDMTELVVNVKGNHEWGLERDDSYDLYQWSIKRFDKSVKGYYEICGELNYDINDEYVTENGYGVESCTYTFRYKS